MRITPSPTASQGENIIFDNVTDDWKRFCHETLAFEIPADGPIEIQRVEQPAETTAWKRRPSLQSPSPPGEGDFQTVATRQGQDRPTLIASCESAPSAFPLTPIR